jgi:uncharacterized protein YciI
MRHFLFVYRPPRTTFADDASNEEQEIIGRHFAYLKQLEAMGALFMAGRIDDGRFGIAVVKAENEEAGRKLLDADPAVKESVFSGELLPFRLAIPGTEQ